MRASGTAGRPKLAWALALLLSAAGLARASDPVPAAGNTIVLIGSSIAAGLGASAYDSAWAGRYSKLLTGLNPAWNLINLAVGGYTTYNVMPTGNIPPANRAAPDTAHNLTKALSLKPACLLISLTGNDISNGYAAAEYEANFDSLRAIAIRAGIKVWVTTPTPRTANDSAKRKLVLALRDRILSRYAPRAIDFYDSLGGADGAMFAQYNSGDGIHPNNPGHALLFRRVAAANIPGITISVILPARGARRGYEDFRCFGVPHFSDQAGKRFDGLGRHSPTIPASAADRILEVTR